MIRAAKFAQLQKKLAEWLQCRAYAKCARAGHRERIEMRDVLRKARSVKPGDSMAIVCYEHRVVCDRCGMVIRAWFCHARGNAFGLSMSSEQRFKFDTEGELVL